MKINMENKYMEIPFEKLFETVFRDDGEPKNCDALARTALILRLEKFYGRPGFGNAKTGLINSMESFLACTFILKSGIKA